MGVYIKNWSLADWKELLKWAKIGANNAMIGEFSEVEEVPPHGRLIEKNDVFELIRSFPNVDRQLPVEFMKALYELPTIIPAEEGE